ncbi:MAG: MATE family efflux transporter [Clostridiales bacterium]|nr:MATE family efflux transporter [Clostridiales bacterium]
MQKSHATDLTQGPIGRGLLLFTAPLLCGQILQQLYNTVDAWVLGNFESAQGLAGITAIEATIRLIISLVSGFSIGGSVIISRYFGERNRENTIAAMHACFIFGLIASALSTIICSLLARPVLVWVSVPADILPISLSYLRIYFLGISTVIMYNICMSIMRAVGDSMHPLFYLLISCVTNIVLDLLFVVVFHWGVAGTALATVLSQGLSCILCMLHMQKAQDETHMDLAHLHLKKGMMGEIIRQGLPMSIQNSVSNIGNMVVQSNFNLYDQLYEGGKGLMVAGMGAYTKVEGLCFLPFSTMGLSLPTFISQNYGAKKYDRLRKGAAFGILITSAFAALLGLLFYFFAPQAIGLFVTDSVALHYGVLHTHTAALFFGMVAFCQCTAGVLRGCGKALIPMISMLSCWCVIRVCYVTLAMKFFPSYPAIVAAYPITWTLCAMVLGIALYRVLRKKGLENAH